MCALQFAAQTEQKDIDRSTDTLKAEDKLKSLNDLLQKHLV